MEEHNAIDRDHHIVLRDDFLPRNFEHLLHHIHATADAIIQRVEEMYARLGDFYEATEALDSINISLPYDGDAHHQEEKGECRYGETDVNHLLSPRDQPAYCARLD